MESSVLKELYTIYNRQISNDAFVFTNNDVPEPLCAIYTSRGLFHIMELQQTNKLTRHSMKFMLEQVKTFSTALTDDQKKYFRNFNSHSELNGL
jgi:molybdopterin-guanine dinucleotide biosynthesis protein A